MATRPLCDSLQKKANIELNEDSSKVEEDIKHMQEWLKKQPHLIARQDDQFILSFLRGCKFSLQKAKQKLDCFYMVRSVLPEYFKNRDPFSPDIQLILNTGGILPLPKPVGANESRAVLFRWSVLNPNTMPFTLLMKVTYLIIDILMKEDDYTVVSGLHFIADYKGFPGGYVTQLTPTALHKAANAIQTGYPLRLKGMEIFNVPNFFDTLYSIIKPALSTKFKDRTKIYTDNYIPSLYDRVPISVLPKEYGGSEVTIDELKDEWKRKCESYAQWCKDDENYYSDEKLRPEDSKNEIFGAEGTFRKLNLD